MLVLTTIGPSFCKLLGWTGLATVMLACVLTICGVSVVDTVSTVIGGLGGGLWYVGGVIAWLGRGVGSGVAWLGKGVGSGVVSVGSGVVSSVGSGVASVAKSVASNVSNVSSVFG